MDIDIMSYLNCVAVMFTSFTHMHTRMYIYIYLSIYSHTHIYIYIYLFTHTYIYIYSHMHQYLQYIMFIQIPNAWRGAPAPLKELRAQEGHERGLAPKLLRRFGLRRVACRWICLVAAT